MTIATPLRHPDATSSHTMTKRGWWLVTMNILVPGSAQLLAGNRILGRVGVLSTLLLWLLGIVTLVVYLVSPSSIYTMFTQAGSLTLVQTVLIAYAVLWVVLTLDTLRLVRLVRTSRNSRGWIAAFSVLVLVGTTSVTAYALVNVAATIGVVHDVFSDGDIAEPIDGRYNILLLGGDAGPDRTGLRPDSISVASIDAETGEIVMFGIPRNLERAPFSEGSPLFGPYPGGYDCGDDCLVSYLYTYGQEHPDLYPKAEKAGSSPGIEAMRDAVQGVLGLKIQYYVLIDMQGFADLVDALGGVDITVSQRIPIGGDENLNGVVEWIEPGQRHLDGYHAQWYARARHGTSDYDRMARQRQLQDAILKQVNPVNVVSKFQDIAKAGSQVMKTDIPQSMLGYFVDLGMKTRKLPISQLELVPPTIDPTDPDYTQIHQLVQQAVHPATAKPTGK